MPVRPRKSLLLPELTRPSAMGAPARDHCFYWLDKNENLDRSYRAKVESICRQVAADELMTYPELGPLYEKLSLWVGLSAESLLLTQGSDGAIKAAFETFVDKGDSVVITSPSFAMYDVYCKSFGAQCHAIHYERIDNAPVLPIEALIETVENVKPKLVCLPNPDSPTGTIQKEDALRELLRVCERNASVLLVDEAYHPFYDWSVVPWVCHSENLIVARTFSKAWGLAGVRVGYTIANPALTKLLHQGRPMYELGSLACGMVSRMLENPEMMYHSVKALNSSKAYFMDRMQQCGYQVLPTHGNFLHIDFAPKREAVWHALSKKVYFRESFAQECLRGYSRFSIADQEIMASVADLIESV